MAIKIEKGKIPIWEKYMLTVDEAVQYFGIGEGLYLAAVIRMFWKIKTMC